MQSGIYFELPEAEYRADPSMNYSGIKNLLKGRLHYWVNNPALNPDYEEQEDSEAMALGRAYHARILEGREAFVARYAPEFDMQGDDVIKSSSDIMARLKDAGVKGYSGKVKAQLVQMLVDECPELAEKCFDYMQARYIAENAGCEFLPVDWIKRIELAAQIIERNPNLSKCFRGGYPEVSIFWHDSELNVDFKIRVDYLKTRATNDLKSFANMSEKPFNTAMLHEIASRKYYLQAALYLRGVDAAKGLAEAGHVFGRVDAAWLDAFIHSPPHDFTFVFQEKGIAPAANSVTHSRASMMNDSALTIIRQVVDDWKYCRDKFGASPWMDEREPVFAADDDYPMWAWNV